MILSSSAASRIPSIGNSSVTTTTVTAASIRNKDELAFNNDYVELDTEAGFQPGFDVIDDTFDDDLIIVEATLNENTDDGISAKQLSNDESEISSDKLTSSTTVNEPWKDDKKSAIVADISTELTKVKPFQDHLKESFGLGMEQLDGSSYSEEPHNIEEKLEESQRINHQDQNSDGKNSDNEEEETFVPSLLLQWGDDIYSLFTFDDASDPSMHDPSNQLFPGAAELFYCPLDQFFAALKDEFWPPEQMDTREAVIEFVGLDVELSQDSPDARLSTLEDVWKLYIALQAAHKINVEGPLRLIVKDRTRFLKQMEEWENLLTQDGAQDNPIIVDEEDEEEESQSLHAGGKGENYYNPEEEQSNAGNETAIEGVIEIDSDTLATTASRSFPIRRASYVEPNDAELIAYEDAFEEDEVDSPQSQNSIKRKIAYNEHEDTDNEQTKRSRTF